MEHGTKTDQRCSHKGGECDKLGHSVDVIVIFIVIVIVVVIVIVTRLGNDPIF